MIQSLKDELPAYLVKAADLPSDFHVPKDTWREWKTTATDLPSWSAAVEKFVLVQYFLFFLFLTSLAQEVVAQSS